ncbi:MAG: HEAT repeat domain-containing protein [Limisphaerales bacterium]
MSVKRRWKIAIATVAVIVIAAVVVLITANSEPEYKGRTLSEWISAYDDAYADAIDKRESMDAPKSSEAAHALREMTPQILPILIGRISYEKSPRVASIQKFLEPIAETTGFGMRYSTLINRGENRVWAALAVFELLGTNATPAIPQLSNMIMDAKHPDTAHNALQAIASTGNAGTQTIVALLHNPDNPNRSATLAALRLCDFNSPEIITNEIREHLSDPDAHMRMAATNLLESLKPHLY